LPLWCLLLHLAYQVW